MNCCSFGIHFECFSVSVFSSPGPKSLAPVNKAAACVGLTPASLEPSDVTFTLRKEAVTPREKRF